jgi:hypothetical protein
MKGSCLRGNVLEGWRSGGLTDVLCSDLGLVGDAKWLIARPLFLDNLQLADVPCKVNVANFKY